MAVFYSAIDQDIEGDDDLTEPSEMCVYALYYIFIVAEIIYSDKQEEMKIFEDIMKLVPTFKDVVMACSGHRRAFTNFIRMVILIAYILSFLT
jgi:hypothetical protein